MHSPGINGEGELRVQPAISGSPGKMAVKTECVCMSRYSIFVLKVALNTKKNQAKLPILRNHGFSYNWFWCQSEILVSV